MFDVIVVGGGPCGASAAKETATKGAEVILIEKSPIPRYKACGGGISSKALHYIGAPIPNQLIERRIYGFEFRPIKGQPIRIQSNRLVGITTHRAQFDQFLIKQAEKAGCKISQGRVTNIERAKDRMICHLDGGEVLEGKLIVGADGANGITAKAVGLRQQWRDFEVGICFESEVMLPSKRIESILNPQLLYLFYLGVPYGYGWIFPKQDRLSIGIGGQLAALKPITSQMFEKFRRWLEHHLGTRLHPHRVYGHLLPAGGINRSVVDERVMLAGDAAGFVDPLTGEGIYYAIRSGQLAGEIAIEALENQRFTRGFLQRYKRRCSREFGQDLRLALILARLVYPNLNRFFNILRTSRRLPHYMELLAGSSGNYRRLLREFLSRLRVFPLRLFKPRNL